MMFTPEESRNVLALIEVGAKAMSADKPLSESVAIQGTAMQLIDKVKTLTKTVPVKQPEEKTK